MRYDWEHTWMKSTKRLEVEATFTARAGFDLQEPFRIVIDPQTTWISAQFPAPKLISIEMGDVRIHRDEDGLWNKLTPEDREQALKELEKRARKEFERSTILSEALLAGEKRFQEVLNESGVEVRMQFDRLRELPSSP